MKTLVILVTSLLFGNLVLAQVNLDQGLVAFYKFESSFEDETELNNDGFTSNSPIFVPGIDGSVSSACYFEGNQSYVEIEDAKQIDFQNSDDFAISLWIKPDSIQKDLTGTINDIISKWSPSIYVPYSYTIRIFNQSSIDAGKVFARRFYGDCFDVQAIKSEVSIFDGKWHHILLQKRENVLELCVDGKSEGSIPDNSTCGVTNSSNLLLAKRTHDPTFETREYNGGIDELRFYNRFLNTEEKDALFTNTVVKIDEISLSSDFSIYPNPITAYGELHFVDLDRILVQDIEMISVEGKIYRPVNFIIPGNIPAGVYFCRISLKNETVVIKKIVVNSHKA